jgi:hypothetical protein
MNTVTAITDSSGAVLTRYKNGWFKESTKNTRIPGLAQGETPRKNFS